MSTPLPVPLSPVFHLGISLCLSLSLSLSLSLLSLLPGREHKHFATAGRQKFRLNGATGARERGESGKKKNLFLVGFGARLDKTKETYEGP